MFSEFIQHSSRRPDWQSLRGCRQAVHPRPSRWSVGTGLTLALCTLFMVPLSPSLALLTSAPLLLLWGWWAFHATLPAYGALCFVWLTVYNRTILPLAPADTAWQRGGVGLGDLLWLVFTAVWGAHWLQGGLLMCPKIRNWLTLLVLVFLGISVFLPVVGVLVHGYPFSYLAPGVRHIEWVSFAAFGYGIMRRYGTDATLRTFLIALLFSVLLHAAYGTTQLLAFRGFIPAEWTALDLVYAQRFPLGENKLGLHRATGLAHNPNNLGALAAMVFAGWLALEISAFEKGARVRWGYLVFGAFLTLASGSRSAILGAVLGMCVILLRFVSASSIGTALALRGLARIVAIMFLLVGGLASIIAFVMPYAYERISWASGVFTKGISADENLAGRTEFWQNALNQYELSYPAGTLVAPTYALGVDIDNYFVFLLVQGTPVLLGVFVLMLIGYLIAGWQAVDSSEPHRQLIGFWAIGILCVVLVASITLTPLLSASGIVMFWTFAGWLLATMPRHGRL